MVSRSLEKMMLIAIGLTTAVIVGVPVLMYTMDIISNTSILETAEAFAARVHNLTSMVDNGQVNDTAVEVNVPLGIKLSAQDSTLTITLMDEDSVLTSWSAGYTRNINLVAPNIPGIYLLWIQVDGDFLEITFSATQQ
ncbi:MAG: hypothetical protein ACW99U_05980 [Candidatus Thorarchaeota archaeon]|jgi:hypothetical protein